MIVPSGLKRGANRRLAGEDVRKGSIVLPAGRRLAAQDVALAAAVGLTRLKVRRRVRVALFSTGDEIVEPGTPRPDAALYDANRYLLGGMLERLGAQTTDLGILKTTRTCCPRRSPRPRRITTWCSPRAACRPAKRITCATRSRRSAGCGSGASPSSPDGRSRWASCPARGNGAAFVGLPGNPVAAFVTFARVVRPLLLRLGGAQAEPLTALPVKLAFDYKKKSGRREYVRVALRRAADGTIEAVRHPQEGAGVITSLTETDGLAELNEDSTAIAKGATVGFLSYATLMG